MGSTLAHYAARGVKVYYICATGGEAGTVDPEQLKGYASIAEKRRAEMAAAAKVLGLADVIYLGYRDSGMPGSPDNKHPDSLAMASIPDAAGRIVKVFRNLKPDVVITHDAGGGYGHPDHVATHKATVLAVQSAGDPGKYPEAGAPCQLSRLYFGVRTQRFFKMMVKIMPLFGQDPRHFGRNRDIDLTRIVGTQYPIHATVRLTKQDFETRNRAAACHASQGGGGRASGLFRMLMFMERLRGGRRDYFMRAYPPPTGSRQEKDLFEGVRVLEEMPGPGS